MQSAGFYLIQYDECIWRKSMMGLMIWKSSLVWYSSSYTISFRGIFMDFQETRNPGAERRIRWSRDDFVEPDCIIIIIGEGIIECKCPLEPSYKCSILKF